MNNQLSETLIKILLRKFWRFLIALKVNLSLYLFRERLKVVSVFYGGARAGNHGGPLVKIQRLSKYFPQEFWRYNIVYALSNAPYLSTYSLKKYKSLGIPLVLNQNGVYYPGWYKGDYLSMNQSMADLYHSADYVFWQSEFCRRAANKFLGTRNSPGEILFNAIDTDYFCPREMVDKSRPFTFLLTGKIDQHMTYRVQNTLEGLKVSHDNGFKFNLIIAGAIDNATLTLINKEIKILDLVKYVRFIGPYNQINAPNIYKSADAYVTTKYLDPCPNTVIEAMSCGLPILHSSSGGTPELVGLGGVGLSIEENWEKNLYHTGEEVGAGMIQIYKNNKSMGQIARNRAIDMFDIKVWINRHKYIFNKLVGVYEDRSSEIG